MVSTIYRGIDISGEWISTQEYSGNVIADQTIQLKQKGHKITGTLISRNKIPSKGEDTTSFKLLGEIFDNYVDIEYQVDDQKLDLQDKVCQILEQCHFSATNSCK